MLEIIISPYVCYEALGFYLLANKYHNINIRLLQNVTYIISENYYIFNIDIIIHQLYFKYRTSVIRGEKKV